MKKEKDLTFIILCPDNKVPSVRTTLDAVNNYYPCSSMVAVFSDGFDDKSVKLNCKICVGGDTITSLINKGMQETTTDWNMIIIAGLYLRPNLHNRFAKFVTSDNDVLFPVMVNRMDFVSASINGLVLNKHGFKRMGEFPTLKKQFNGNRFSDFEQTKIVWGHNALSKGCVFKGIVGLKIS